MPHKYQTQDFDICDYELYSLPGIPQLLRGPRPNNLSGSTKFIAFLGAAQTFGTLCRYPFPNLLSSMLGVQSLNLGLGGAGPRKFLHLPAAIERVNRARCCVIQVMSGRTADNSLMTNPPGGSMFRWRNESSEVPLRHSELLYQELIAQKSPPELAEIVRETRDSWVKESLQLAEKIAVPKILLWLSTREPDYQSSYSTVVGLFGAFPQLVDGPTLARITGYFDRVAMSVSRAGLPAPLLNRFTGGVGQVQRDRHLMQRNGYYPSQEMHMRAALALYPVVAEYLR
jgi:hypothetical protein